MVRHTKFSFDEGMNVDYPQPEDDFDGDDDLSDLVTDRIRPVKSPSPPRHPKRDHPGNRRPDRRHIAHADWANGDWADADWLKNSAPEERGSDSGMPSTLRTPPPQSASP